MSYQGNNPYVHSLQRIREEVINQINQTRLRETLTLEPYHVLSANVKVKEGGGIIIDPDGGGLAIATGSFNGFDNIGNEEITTTPKTIPISVVSLNTDRDVFTMQNDEVTVHEDGVYDITYEVTAGVLPPGETYEVVAWLEIDDPLGAGWIEVPGTKAYFGEVI